MNAASSAVRTRMQPCDRFHIRTVIVDYGMGNLFSVRQACEAAGLSAIVSASKVDVLQADAVLLPGVGAFGDAMATLARLDLVGPLRDVAAAGKPFIGVCLGMQLLMTESEEFGAHRGLGLIEGGVLRLERGPDRVKVPHVGWNRVSGDPAAWQETPLAGTCNGEHFYFVHSYYARPADSSVVVSTTGYGGTEFCSSLARGNVFGCQFHPERSGRAGLTMYRNAAAWCASRAAALRA